MGISNARRAVLAFAFAAGVSVSALAGVPLSAAGTPSWRVDLVVHPPAPYPARDTVMITSVTAPGGNDVWAAGAVSSTSSRTSPPVILHWNGRMWRTVRPAAPIATDTGQFEIAASGSADVWVFNQALSLRSGGRPAWAHWNGRAWAHGSVPVPVVSSSEGVLITSAVAPKADDVWAGGTINDPDTPTGLPGIPFLMNYNGRTWRFYKLASASDSLPAVTGMSALGPDDIWALVSPAGPLFGVGVPDPENLLLHWNGRSWQRILLKPGQAPQGEFYDIVAESARGTWVTGTVHKAGPHGGTWSPAAAYWNGSRWKVVTAAAPYSLTSAVSDGHDGLWAVSQPEYSPQAELDPPTGFWHYANGRWTHVPVAVNGWDIVVQLAHAPGTGSVWAAGSALRSGPGSVPPGPATGLIFSSG